MPRTSTAPGGPTPHNVTDTMAGEGDCTIPPLQFTSSASPTNDFLWRLRYLKTFGDSAYPPPMPTDVQLNMTPSDAAITWSSLEEHVVSTQRRWKRFDTPSIRANTPSYAGSRLGAASPTTNMCSLPPQQLPITPQPGSTCKVALHQKQLDEADQGGDAPFTESPVSRVAGLPPKMSRNISNVGGRGKLAAQRASIGGDRRLSVRFALPGDNKTPVLPNRKGAFPSTEVAAAPSSSPTDSEEDIAELGEVLEGFVAFPTDAFEDNGDLASNWGGLNSDDGGGGLFKPPLLVIPNSEELLLPSQHREVVPYSPLSVSSPTVHSSGGPKGMGAAMLGQALTEEAAYFMPHFHDGELQEMSYAVAALRAAAWPLLMDGSIAFNHCVGEHSAVSVAGRFETASSVGQTTEEYGGSTFLSSLMYLHHKRQATISQREQQSWDANFIEERNRVTLKEENARLKRFAQKEMKALPQCMQFTQSHLDVIRRLVATSGGAASAFKKAAAAFEAKHLAKQSKSNKQVTDRLVTPGVIPKGLSAATPSLGGAAHAALVLASSPSSTSGGVVANPLYQRAPPKFFAHTKTHPIPPSKQTRPTEVTELDQGPYGVWPIEADDVLAAQRATANPQKTGTTSSSTSDTTTTASVGRSFRLSDQASIAMRPFMACISNPATLVSQGGSRETAYNLFPPHFSFAMDWHEAFRRRRHWELSPFLFFLVRDVSFNYSHIAALLDTVVTKCSYAAHTHSVSGEDLQGLAWCPPGSYYKVSSGEAFATEVVQAYCSALKRGAHGGLGQQLEDGGAAEGTAAVTLGPRATRCYESAKMAHEVASRASVGTCLCGVLFTPPWDNVDELGAPIPGVSQLRLHEDGSSTKGKKRKQNASQNNATQMSRHSATGLTLSPFPTTSELLATPPLMATFLKRIASGRVDGCPAPSAPTHHHNSTAPSPLLMTTTSPVCPMGLLQKSMDDVVAVYEHTSNGKTLELLAWLLRYFTVKQLHPRPPPSSTTSSAINTSGEHYEAHRRFTEVEYNYLFLLSDFMDTQWDGRGRTLPSRAVDNVGGAFSLAQTVEKRLLRLRAAQQLRGDSLGTSKGVTPGAGIPEALQRSLLESPWPVLPQVPTASLFSTPLMLLCSYARPYIVNWLRPIVLQLSAYFESYHLSSTYALEEMAAEREDAENGDPTLAGESPVVQRTRSGRKTGRTPTNKTTTATPSRSRLQTANISNSTLEDTEDLRQQRIRRRCRVQMYTSTEDVKSSIDRIATKVSSLEESVDNIFRLRAAQNVGSNEVSPRLVSANVPPPPTTDTTTTLNGSTPRYIRDLLLEREHHIAECVEDGLSMVSRLLVEHADTFPPGVRYLISKFTAMISVHLLSTLVPPLVLRDCLSAVSQNDTTELVDRLVAAISPAGDGNTSQYESPIVTDVKGGRLAKLVLYDLLILPILRDPVGAGILAPGDATTTTSRSAMSDNEKGIQSLKSQPNTRSGSPTFYASAESSRSEINDESKNGIEEGIRAVAADKRSITSEHARHNFTALAAYLQITISGPFAARRDHFSDQLRRKCEPTSEEDSDLQDPRVTKFINDCYDKEVGACFAGLPRFNKLTSLLAGLYNISTGHLSKYTPIQTNFPPPRKTSLYSNASLATPAQRSYVHSAMSTRRLSSVANTPIQLAVEVEEGGSEDHQDGAGLLVFGDPSVPQSTSTYCVPGGASLDHLLTERTKRHLHLSHLLPSSRSGAASRQPSFMVPRPPTTATPAPQEQQTPTTSAPKTPRKPASKGSAAASAQWGDGISNLLKGTVNTVEGSNPATYSLSPLMARLNERLGLIADGEGVVRNITASQVHRHFLSRVGPGYQRRLFVIGSQGTSSVAAAYRFHEGMFQRKMGGSGSDTGYDGRGSVEPWSFLWDGGMPMDADAVDLLDTFAFYSSTDHSTTAETSALWENWKAETGFECTTSLPPSVISGRMVSSGVPSRVNTFSTPQIPAANQPVVPLPAFPLELACHPHRRLLVPPKILRHLHKQATTGVRLEAWRFPSQDFIVNCTSSLFKVATSSHEALLASNDNRVPLSFGPTTTSTDVLRMAAKLGQLAADTLCGKQHNSTSSLTSGIDDFGKATISSVVAKQWKGTDVEEGGVMVEQLLKGLLVRYGLVGSYNTNTSGSGVSTMQDTSPFTQSILHTLAHPLFVGTALDNIHVNNQSLYDALLLQNIQQENAMVSPTSAVVSPSDRTHINPIAHMIDALPPLDEVGFLLQCLRDFCSSPFGTGEEDTGRTHGIDSNGAISVAAAIGGGEVPKPYLPSSLGTKQRWFVDSALLAHRYKMTLNEKSGGAAGRMPTGLGSNYGGDSDPSTPSMSSPLGAMMRLTDLGQEDDDENTRIRMEKFAAEALTELTAKDPLRAPPPRGIISLSAPSFAPPIPQLSTDGADLPSAVPTRGRFGRGAAPRTVGVQPIPQPSTQPVDAVEVSTYQGAPLVDRWWSYMMLAQVGKINRLLVECGVSREGSPGGSHTKIWEDACEAQVKRATRSTTMIKPSFDRVGARIPTRKKEVTPVEDTAPLHRAVEYVAHSEAVKKGAQRLEGARGMPHDGPLATATAVSLRGVTALGIELDTPPSPHPPTRSKLPSK